MSTVVGHGAGGVVVDQGSAAWGAESAGERILAGHLLRTVGDRAHFLHDRTAPHSAVTIDHLVVAPSGIWIVDARRIPGRVEQRNVGSWLRYDPRLFVGSRERSELVESMIHRTNGVLEAIGDSGLPVRSALCFVDSSWGLFAKPFKQTGVLVTWPTNLSARIAADGPLGGRQAAAIADRLNAALPPAV